MTPRAPSPRCVVTARLPLAATLTMPTIQNMHFRALGRRFDATLLAVEAALPMCLVATAVAVAATMTLLSLCCVPRSARSRTYTKGFLAQSAAQVASYLAATGSGI